MEDVKKPDEASKPEALAERVELTDEQLDQASGGMPSYLPLIANEKIIFSNIGVTAELFE